MSNFAQRLKAARLRKGVTQEWMAKQLNIHRTSYTKYETGVAEPSLQTFCVIAKILDVDLMELLK